MGVDSVIKQCTVELGCDNMMYTNFDTLNPSSYAKLKLLGGVNMLGLYKHKTSDLEMIYRNCEYILLKNPANIISPYRLAYSEVLRYFKDPRRILPFTSGSITIKYNQPPTKLDQKHVENIPTFKDEDAIRGDSIWNSLFLYSWDRLHDGERDYTLEGYIEYTRSSNVTGLDDSWNRDYRVKDDSDLDTLTMCIYEYECAYYVAPSRIFELTEGRMTPISFSEPNHSNRFGDRYYTMQFIVDKGYLTVDKLKQLKRFGSLIEGTALHGVESDDIDGFQCIPRY